MTIASGASRIVSIDSGSSFFKFFDGRERLTPFPSAIHRLPPEAPDDDDEVLTVGGVRYLVGQDALCEDVRLVAKPHTEAAFHGSDDQAVQVCYALNKAGVQGDAAALVASLPYDLATRAEYKGLRDRIKARRRFEWTTKRGGPTEVTFREVYVVAQGVGAWKRYKMGRPESGNPECVVVVDIGSCTLDLVTMRLAGPNRYRYSSAACGSMRVQCSVSGFFDTWSTLLRQHDGLQDRTFSFYQLMQRAMAGRFLVPHLATEVDIQPTFLQARRQYTELVGDVVRGAVGHDLWPAVNRVILTGGGAKLILPDVWRDGRLEVLDTWANAEGQYHMIREHLTSGAGTVPVKQHAATGSSTAAAN